jgi:hypothetical protein
MKKASVSSQSAAHATSKRASIALSAEDLDTLHDAGDDLEPYMDTAQTRRPGREVQRVNVDFPLDLLRAIDAEAKRIGVTRQAFIKLRLADTLSAKP